MTQLPSINIVVITFMRRDVLAHTLAALFDNLGYDGDISWIIADDCTPEPDYHYFIRSLPWRDRTMRIETPPENGGWGVNANNALRKCEHDITFFIEDDYILTRPVDLSPYVALLLENTVVGLVRMDGIAGHLGLSCQTAETNVSAYCPQWRQGIAYPGKLHYWLLDRKSTQFNMYSNRPHLKHRRFHEAYGEYHEGFKLGLTETKFAHIVKDKMRDDADSVPAIAAPFDANCYFDHIGESFQLTEYDKGSE